MNSISLTLSIVLQFWTAICVVDGVTEKTNFPVLEACRVKLIGEFIELGVRSRPMISELVQQAEELILLIVWRPDTVDIVPDPLFVSGVPAHEQNVTLHARSGLKYTKMPVLPAVHWEKQEVASFDVAILESIAPPFENVLAVHM